MIKIVGLCNVGVKVDIHYVYVHKISLNFYQKAIATP